MTTIGVQLGLFSGQTNLTLWLFNNGVLLNTGGDTLTEVGTSGFFQATVAEAITTSLSVVVRQAGVLVYEGVLLLGQTVVDFNPIPLDAAGTRSALDWTQVRHRLGIDGSKTAPSSSNPSLGTLQLRQLVITQDTVGEAAIQIVTVEGKTIDAYDTVFGSALTVSAEEQTLVVGQAGGTIVAGIAGNVSGKVLGGGSSAIVGVGVRSELGTNAIGSDQLAASAITEIQTGLATSSQVNAVGVIAATIEGNMATDAKQDQILDAIGNVEATANVTILPNVVRQAELQQGSKIKAWVRQGSPIFGSVYDTANNPVDLSAFTGIKFTATTANGVELLVIESDDIEITGTDNNTFHFDPPVELVERARVLQWSIRDEADDELISSGTLEIVFAP